MALIVKFLSEPDAGSEKKIEESDNEVTFGRGLDCDIGFPADLTIVSRDHFRLRREVGSYKFVISKERPVFMNGRPVIDGQELPRTADIQLSGPTGPKLRIERVDEALANLPKTEILGSGQDIGDIVAAQRSGGRRLAGWLAGITALVALVAAGVYFLREDVATTQGQVAEVTGQVNAMGAKVADIDARLPELSQKIAAVEGAQPPDIAALIAAHKESVYRVSELTPGGEEYSMATAWVVALPDGTKALATNSHVAAMYDEVQDPEYKGYRLVATQPKAPDFTRVTIIGAKKHPGYDPYNSFWEELVNVQAVLEALAITPMLGYDVALLYVDKPELLGEPLKLAPPEKLARLAAGQRLLLIGYPSENLSNADWTRPEPTSQTGMVTSNTSFFLFKGDYGQNQLIQHSVPTAGGASGSPIFNLEGEVVGLHSAGSYLFLKDKDERETRIGSAALVNFAQRIDLLQELMDGSAEAKLPAYEAFWEESAKRLYRSAEDVVTDLLGYAGAKVGGRDNLREIVSLTGKAERYEEGLNARVAIFEVSFEEEGQYYFVGWSNDRRRTLLMVFDAKGEMILKGSGGGFVSEIALSAFPAKYGKAYVAVIDDYAGEKKDARPPAEMTLKIYQGPPAAPEEG